MKIIVISILIIGCMNGGNLCAQNHRVDTGGSLGSLIYLHTGRSMEISSAAPERSSNRDFRRILPGHTLVLADIHGAGIIKHIWLTFPHAAPGWLGKNAEKKGNANPSELVFKMYWDGAKEPAVEAPLGDFFAAGFGHRAPVKSMPIQVEGGDAYNSFWRMPFYKSARIVVENQSTKPCNSFYYKVDYVLKDSLPPGTPYFCAQYRQEFPVKSGHDYLILKAEGRGQYVGTVLSVRSRSPGWFGEGDDKFYVDGAERPTIQGTGTEDYVLNAWGLSNDNYPYFGVSYQVGNWGMVGFRTTIYRWHIASPIIFTRSLRVSIEDAGGISKDELKKGVSRGFVERNDDFSSVAFWYQLGQPVRFTTLPTAKERELPNLDKVVEGKELLETAHASDDSALSLQKGYYWTGNGQLFFDNNSKHGWLEVTFPVVKKELRQLTLRMTQSDDYGIYDIVLDGKTVRKGVDFYSPYLKTEDLNLGQRTLSVGTHTLMFVYVGKQEESGGRKLGFDSVRLRRRWHVKRETPKDLDSVKRK